MARGRRKDEVETDRQIIMPLYFKGYTLRDIAARCTAQTGRYVSHITVRADIKNMLEDFRRERNDMIEYNLTIELEKINVLELEYWQGWEKSKTDKRQKSMKRRESSDSKSNNYTEQSETEMVNMGDPRYLEGVQWCIATRCKLLGIEAPKRVDVTTAGEKIEFKGFNFLPYTKLEGK
jgi:hypothetical protein